MASLRHPDRSAIALQQRDRLRLLLNALGKSNKFYSAKIEQSGLFEDRDLVESFRRQFPFTHKHQLVTDQIKHPPFGTNLTYASEWYTRYHQTSGTSGAPLRWLDEAESWGAMVSHWRHILAAAEVRHSDRVMFAFSFGPFIGFWLAFEAASQMGCLCLPGGSLSSASRVKMIMDNRATVLCCTPTYALRLAEQAGVDGYDSKKSPVRLLLVAGEPGGSNPAVRGRLEQAWPKARVFDHHGMTETGPVSFECPQNPCKLHIMEDAFLAEIVNPETGEHVNLGEKGELVLTTLQRVGSPLLRYRTGDLVQGSTRIPCSCGSHALALDGGILGRVDDMMVVRGVNVFPSAVDQIIQQNPEIAEYQVKVTEVNALAEVEITIETAPGCPDPDALAINVERDLHTAFNLRMPVRPVKPGTLPRFEMKAKRWIR